MAEIGAQEDDDAAVMSGTSASSANREDSRVDDAGADDMKPSALKSVPEGEQEKAEEESDGLDSTAQKRPSKRRKKKGPGIGFADLAKRISSKWKAIDKESLARYTGLAAIEKERYKQEVEAYQLKKSQEMERNRETLEASVDESTKERYFSVMSERQRKKR